MKILFPVGSFYPTTFGGPGTILYWHTLFLKKQNIKPVIVTTTEGINGQVTVNQFHDLPCGRIYYGDGSVLKLQTIKAVLGEIKTSHIIHLTSLFSPLSFISFFYSSFFHKEVKIVWSVRGELNSRALSISSNKKRFLLFLYKSFVKDVVFASTSNKETLEIKNHFSKNRIIEIPNLMPIPERIKRSEGLKRFLYLGRIHPIKNIEALIEGFCMSKASKDPEVFLDLAGVHDERDEDYFKTLENLVEKYQMKEKIKFLGHISGKEKNDLLANSYFLVLPSHSENFGNVVIEALAQGTPVIASSKTPWEDLYQQKCGFWIENNSQTLADTIDESVLLPEVEYKQYRIHSMRYVDENYNISVRIKDWIEEYKTLRNDQ